jgi:hypothetical protein
MDLYKMLTDLLTRKSSEYPMMLFCERSAEGFFWACIENPDHEMRPSYSALTAEDAVAECVRMEWLRLCAANSPMNTDIKTCPSDIDAAERVVRRLSAPEDELERSRREQKGGA